MQTTYIKTYKTKNTRGKTLNITIPALFVKQHHLKACQQISCYLSDDRRLIICPDRRDLQNRVFIRTYRLRLCGKSSLVVTIPSHFRDMYNLKKGDELDCHLSNKEVLYAPKSRRPL